jgi:Substrate binding domain of ABC-type glycine betaine transport system
VTALQEGVVNAAVLFTTDGNLAAGDLALLVDNRHLQPAENVVPVITDTAMARYGQRLAGPVNAVSARLTSKSLLFLNWRIEVAGSRRKQRAGGSARLAGAPGHGTPATLNAARRSWRICPSRRPLQPCRRLVDVAVEQELLEDLSHAPALGPAEAGRRQI